MINQAERPVIIGGHGILASGATQELKALAETTGIPVINTLLGLSGFPRNHPLSLGMLGMHGMYWSNMVPSTRPTCWWDWACVLTTG